MNIMRSWMFSLFTVGITLTCQGMEGSAGSESPLTQLMSDFNQAKVTTFEAHPEAGKRPRRNDHQGHLRAHTEWVTERAAQLCHNVFVSNAQWANTGIPLDFSLIKPIVDQLSRQDRELLPKVARVHDLGKLGDPTNSRGLLIDYERRGDEIWSYVCPT